MDNPLQTMLQECGEDATALGMRIAGVLEFLTIRAAADKPYIIFTDNEDAMTLIAAGDAVAQIRSALEGIEIKDWEDPLDDEVESYLHDQDPGDEQDEPAPESE